MPAPVTLPRRSWGDPAAARRVLLVHGLGSSAALMWRFGSALADAGHHAVAVDLRGHGDAPRTLDYSIAAYAADVAGTRPETGGAWDAVVAHSLGGAAATVASASDPGWTRRLVLVDPAIRLADRDRELVRESLTAAFADPTITAVRTANPHWHPLDVELKTIALQQASPWAIAETSAQNVPWDVLDAAAAVRVPTLVIGADPAVHSIFTGELAETVLQNPAVTMTVVPDAGHSPHRDRPEATVGALLGWLG